MNDRSGRHTERVSMLHETLAYWATTQPDAPFVVEADTRRALTYGACARALRGCQHWLAGWSGDGPRTVALALPGGIENALIWLGTLMGGHRLVPCAPDIPPAEFARVAGRWQPDLLVMEDTTTELAASTAGMQRLGRAQLAGLVEQWCAHTTGEDLPLPPGKGGELLLTTSGTTGIPKGVRLRADQLAWTAAQIQRSHRLTQADRGLAVLPFYHINAPVVSLLATLSAGATVVIAPRFSASQFWAWIARERITWASIAPAIAAVLLNSADAASHQPHPGLRFVRTASAPLPVTHLHAFERRFGVPVVETYGLSEAAGTVTANPVPPGVHRPGSVGLPCGVELRICVAGEPGHAGPLRDVAPGAEGEICVRGPSVIAAYEEGASASAFHQGWFRTGDLGYRDGAGYVFITGRLREIINYGGHKIAPREIEETLLAHPRVREAAVAGEPDPIYGQRVIAYVVPDADTAASDAAPLAETLRTFCAQQLSAHKVPASFTFVAALPRTATGKVQRHALSPALNHALSTVEIPARATGPAAMHPAELIGQASAPVSR